MSAYDGSSLYGIRASMRTNVLLGTYCHNQSYDSNTSSWTGRTYVRRVYR